MPSRCCRGSRAARRATRASRAARLRRRPAGRRAAAARAGTPRTWATSSSASTRGESTPAAASRAAARATSAADRQEARLVRRPRHPLGAVGGAQGVEHRVEVAVEHPVEVVGLVADAVVGDPVLRVVVGAHALGAVDGAYLAAAVGRRLGLLGLVGDRLQARAQHVHRARLVLQLRALVLAGHDHAGGQVGDPDGGVGGVDALPALARGPEDVDAQVLLVDLDGRGGVRPRGRRARRRPRCGCGPATR